VLLFSGADMGRTPTSTGPRWPSLEEQLSVSRVKRGSALETLIKSNQNFEILRPDEAHDDLGFPLWLRVYFRKAHPEIDFSGGRVGYPLILKEVLGFMLRHQDQPEGGQQQR
jgi:hypothetical protein